jgi:glycosyltransferase involved in cell wall biosynthesis
MSITAAAVTPRVSVLVTTYNQAPWVAQALESVIDQATSFDFEIIVGDDESSDGTRSIAERFAATHRSRVRILPPAPRAGMHANFARCLRDARGEYAAVLNGDDYWLSPHKMQMQAEALDSHPDWSMCFHPVRTIGEDGRTLLERAGPENRPAFGTRDLLRSDIVPTCSTMFRRHLLGEPPAWAETLPMGDWTTWLLLSQQGALGYLPATLAAYRVRSGGAWSGMAEMERLRAEIRFLMHADEYLERRFTSTVRRSLSDRYRRLGLELMRSGDTAAARDALAKSVAHRRTNLAAWRVLARCHWNMRGQRP